MTARAGWYDAEQLRRISELTIAHYDRSAEAYWNGTRDHDVSQNYAALLDAIEGDPPYSILDLGCGPGRDLRYFRSLGHHVVGLDGSMEFVAMARSYSGWVRGNPTGFPGDEINGEPLRCHLCERIAVPRAEPGAVKGFGGTLRDLAVPGCAFLLKPERKQPGRPQR
jgi:SAM-dependent methyltransferase